MSETNEHSKTHEDIMLSYLSGRNRATMASVCSPFCAFFSWCHRTHAAPMLSRVLLRSSSAEYSFSFSTHCWHLFCPNGSNVPYLPNLPYLTSSSSGFKSSKSLRACNSCTKRGTCRGGGWGIWHFDGSNRIQSFFQDCAFKMWLHFFIFMT